MPTYTATEEVTSPRVVKDQLLTQQQESQKTLDVLTLNIQSFTDAESWLKKTINRRIKEVTEQLDILSFQEISEAPIWDTESAWAKVAQEFHLETEEVFMLVVIYVAQFQPSSLSELWAVDKLDYKAGGKKREGDGHRTPTLRTVLFLLAGDKAIKRAFYYARLVQSRLFKEQVLVTKIGEMDSLEDQQIKMNNEYYRWLMNGQKARIEISADFPANVLETHLCFDDLVLKDSVRTQLQYLMDFVQHQRELYSNESFASKIKPGYVAMLYGPPGTGKTMTVSVMGKALDIDVYSIDLSRVVSKYIGETEKNLEKIFERLEGKRCILFFDEADALFGKRTEVKDAKDRYANQEVAYLLQKIERFPGLVILASNYSQNLDSAFRRRILTSIFMPPPGEEERQILWERAIPDHYRCESASLLGELAKKHTLTGANIANIVKLACIRASKEGERVLTHRLLADLIKLEQSKEKN
ncbi:ATP-binding protein [Reichenbachiella carrageenanivorans]|uniref:ATP-binding protein n=1 Tax=Reichenbachiella carrageenanivorans TaxID=2979869 RepID=A0ABY6CY17_9BACT|nr:ATP-binding protein [Reichenbachiella carrageenanivorans]UXX77743.1 ATP-binding protein [Reichenbachiella carrageenanivorans]